ncbi:helix-turn-helix domain-containing protein [Photorhabdus kleinii]|uniref:helix-turn-helix transcriptional regulator n=1 Tax=Photorhabdus kleinii TaxID=768034 RepID=UPI0021D496BA|nr:helix-turn-helix transcriptional regulator [Photorhabdus kleinii]MCT8345140.1 helix-turn-helix domain-containing protein [Photorhabdus kleinii]
MNKLRFFRKQLGMTQIELAELAKCTPGAICHYERGRRGMDINLCRRFVEIFNECGIHVGLDDIFPPKAA